VLSYLLYGGPPWLLLVITAIVNFGLVCLGYVVGRYFESAADDSANGPFGVAQASIFGVTTLILAFSFSLSASRFDTRTNLVVGEANAIDTTYMRAAYLRREDASRFRALLATYVKLRLQAYSSPDRRARYQAAKQSSAVQDQLWEVAAKASRAAPQNVELALLTQSLSNAFDASGEVAAANNNHLPASVVGLVLIVTFASAFMMGLTFGRARTSSISMAIAFSVLFAFVVAAIVDLDRPESGLVNVNLTPLQSDLQLMSSQPTP
jgi:hypothetical protein